MLCVSNSVRWPMRAAASAASVPAWPPPTTITSKASDSMVGFQRRCRRRATMIPPWQLRAKEMFHVKPARSCSTWNTSLADAELGKDLPQQIIRCNLTGDLTQRALRQSQLLGEQLQFSLSDPPPDPDTRPLAATRPNAVHARRKSPPRPRASPTPPVSRTRNSSSPAPLNADTLTCGPISESHAPGVAALRSILLRTTIRLIPAGNSRKQLEILRRQPFLDVRNEQHQVRTLDHAPGPLDAQSFDRIARDRAGQQCPAREWEPLPAGAPAG